MTARTTSGAAATLTRLGNHGVVPVIRTDSADQAERAVEWLAAAGYGVFEITLTIPGAVDLIARLAAARPDLLIGAGTVLDGAGAAACLDAGAAFLVSPATLPEVAAEARQRDRCVLLGAATPTEVLAARRAGADAVKVFPASSFGGPAHLKALASVFPDIPLVPTGGVSPDTLAAYKRAGVACVGMGGELVDRTRLVAGDRDGFVVAARAVLAAWREAPR